MSHEAPHCESSIKLAPSKPLVTAHRYSPPPSPTRPPCVIRLSSPSGPLPLPIPTNPPNSIWTPFDSADKPSRLRPLSNDNPQWPTASTPSTTTRCCRPTRRNPPRPRSTSQGRRSSPVLPSHFSVPVARPVRRVPRKRRPMEDSVGVRRALLVPRRFFSSFFFFFFFFFFFVPVFLFPMLCSDWAPAPQ